MATELVVVPRNFQETNYNKISHRFMLILRILSQDFSYLTSSLLHQFVLFSIPRILVFQSTGGNRIRIISHPFYPILNTQWSQNNKTNTISIMILKNVKRFWYMFFLSLSLFFKLTDIKPTYKNGYLF